MGIEFFFPPLPWCAPMLFLVFFFFWPPLKRVRRESRACGMDLGVLVVGFEGAGDFDGNNSTFPPPTET